MCVGSLHKQIKLGSLENNIKTLSDLNARASALRYVSYGFVKFQTHAKELFSLASMAASRSRSTHGFRIH
jgi:hypothetical protein